MRAPIAFLITALLAGLPAIAQASLHSDGSSNQLFLLALLMIAPWILGGMLLLGLLVWWIRRASRTPPEPEQAARPDAPGKPPARRP